MSKVWDQIANVLVAILPVFIAATITFNTWIVTEVLACKYTALTAEDARRIKVEITEEYSDKFDILLDEINRLRLKVDKLSEVQAETLAEVRVLREKL